MLRDANKPCARPLSGATASSTSVNKLCSEHLPVFIGSASLEAMELVVPDPEGEFDAWAVMDAMGVLIDRSLVEVLATDKTRPNRAIGCLIQCMLMHWSGCRAPARRRRCAGGTRCTPWLPTSMQPTKVALMARWNSKWRGTEGADFDNAREAREWALEFGDVAIELRIVVGLLFTLPPSVHSERMVLAERCEALITKDMPARLQCRAWGELSRVLVNSDRRRGHDAARQEIRFARALDAHEPDRFVLYRALCDLVYSPVGASDAEEGARALAEARSIEDVGWPPHGLARRAHAEAFFASSRGDAVEALRWNHRELLDRAIR